MFRLFDEKIGLEIKGKLEFFQHTEELLHIKIVPATEVSITQFNKALLNKLKGHNRVSLSNASVDIRNAVIELTLND
jgi:tRNA isopentenyl-2-thiomethyl-A-37 hydroxylase MiaE